MADNCPYWSHGRCEPPRFDKYDCSWPTSDFTNCAIYKMAIAEQAGGSLQDQLQAADCIPSGAHVSGGRGRVLSDEKIEQISTYKCDRCGNESESVFYCAYCGHHNWGCIILPVIVALISGILGVFVFLGLLRWLLIIIGIMFGCFSIYIVRDLVRSKSTHTTSTRPEGKSRRLKSARVIWWVCTDREEAQKLYNHICKINYISDTGGLVELAECTKVPPDRLAKLRANPPDGVRIIGDHKPGNGPWYAAAILIPIAQVEAFALWYRGGKYNYDLDDMSWLKSQVAEYPLNCDMVFSEFYLANTRILETEELKEKAQTDVQSEAVKEPEKKPEAYYINYENGTIPIGDLPIGTKVMDRSWVWEFRPGENYSDSGAVKFVNWIVVAKDHYDGLQPHVTLLSEDLIGLHTYDNSTGRDHPESASGYNHWGDSGTANASHGLRPWLNSSGIHAGAGFYRAFSENLKGAVLATTLPNKEWKNGNYYSTQDYVFIPSTTELGDSGHNYTYPIGSVYHYFQGAGDAKRVARLSVNTWWYWTRSPTSGYGYAVRNVFFAGEFDNSLANLGGVFAVRPALNLKSEVLVSEIKD
jgi:hypothetical protein